MKFQSRFDEAKFQSKYDEVLGWGNAHPPVSRRFKMMFAWYDCWMGFFWDEGKRRLYIGLIPMIIFRIQFRQKELHLKFGKESDV